MYYFIGARTINRESKTYMAVFVNLRGTLRLGALLHTKGGPSHHHTHSHQWNSIDILNCILITYHVVLLTLLVITTISLFVYSGTIIIRYKNYIRDGVNIIKLLVKFLYLLLSNYKSRLYRGNNDDWDTGVLFLEVQLHYKVW